jgi:FkbM family methyltransferase
MTVSAAHIAQKIAGRFVRLINISRAWVGENAPFFFSNLVLLGREYRFATDLNDRVIGGWLRGEVPMCPHFLAEFEFLREAVKSEAVVLDIGANIGVTAVGMAIKMPNARIYAFEPVPQNFSLLNLNLSINHVQNVRAFNLAVGSTDGSVEMLLSPRNHGDHRLYVPDQDGAETTDLIRVQVSRVNPVAFFAKMFGSGTIGHADLIKIDTQGADLDVLRAVLPLCKSGTIVSIEFSPHHLAKFGSTVSEVREIFGQFGSACIVMPISSKQRLVPTTIEVLERYFTEGAAAYRGYLDLVLTM